MANAGFFRNLRLLLMHYCIRLMTLVGFVLPSHFLVQEQWDHQLVSIACQEPVCFLSTVPKAQKWSGVGHQAGFSALLLWFHAASEVVARYCTVSLQLYSHRLHLPLL